jgi:hypothetical protein
MSEKLEFDEQFLADLEKIDGPHLQQWRLSLLFRLRDSLWDMPKYKWHGRYPNSKVGEINLSSCVWHSSGFRRISMTIWYLHNVSTRVVLYAEHQRTEPNQNPGALEVALSRAELSGYLRATFVPAPTMG